MREIKFRIWNVSAKKMWGWDLMVRNSIFALDSKLPSCEDFVALPKQNESHIWMQYTGLKDKNGKEIFEGDIVKSVLLDPQLREVKFINGRFVFVSQSYWADAYNFFRECEIIGNVYEHPELLGGVK